MFEFHQRPLTKDGIANWDNIFGEDGNAEEAREMRTEGVKEDQAEEGQE